MQLDKPAAIDITVKSKNWRPTTRHFKFLLSWTKIKGKKDSNHVTKIVILDKENG